MGPRGDQPEHEIARSDIWPGQDIFALDRADREACKIIVLAEVKSRHFRRLAPDKRAAGIQAAFGHTGDHLPRGFHVEFAGREIVKKKQRLRTLDEKIVNRHRDQIDAYRRMNAGFDRKLELGPHSVIGGDQHGVAIAAGLEVEECAEAAQLRIAPSARRRPGKRLDCFDERVSGRNINACIGVANSGPDLFGSAHAVSLPQSSVAMPIARGTVHTKRKSALSGGPWEFYQG